MTGSAAACEGVCMTPCSHAGGLVALLPYRNDNHNISNNLSTTMRQSVQFFDKHVKDAG